MLQALRVPIEKLKKKEIDTIKERITCLKWELGYTPAIKQIKESLREAFEKTFNISLVEEGLTKEEQALFKINQTIFKSKKWVEKIRFPKEEQPLVISTHITDGGLLRIALLINLRIIGLKM
jgi:lipoate---protein ligase